MHKLEGGDYQLLEGELVWLEEINLGIGREEGTYQGITREWLYWYDQGGKKYLTAEETAVEAKQRAVQAKQEAAQAEQRAAQAKQRAAKLAEKFRRLGIDPDSIDS